MKPWSVVIRGRRHEWAFDVLGTETDAAEWRADGLEVDEVCATVPDWVASLGLTGPWCALQECVRRLGWPA